MTAAPAAKRVAMPLSRVPDCASQELLSYLDAPDLARLGETCAFWRCAVRLFAEAVVDRQGWGLSDGVGAVERLATEVCTFDAESFRAVGGGAPRLRSARRRGTAEVLRVAQRAAPPGDVSGDRARGSVAAVFSEHGSKLVVREPGRYRVSGRVEPCLRTDSPRGPRKRPRGDDAAEGRLVVAARAAARAIHPGPADDRNVRPRLAPAAAAERLCFQVRVLESGPPLSSIYVGVATRRWARGRSASQAIRSDECWLLDLRRARFVHGFPSYDRAMAAAHGDRARQHATTDDVVETGDVLGVRVVGGSAHFYRNGRRLAFSAGGRADLRPGAAAPPANAGAAPPDDDAARAARDDDLGVAGPRFDVGWGRPIPRDVDLVPIVEVHSRAQAPADAPRPRHLALEVAAWDAPVWCEAAGGRLAQRATEDSNNFGSRPAPRRPATGDFPGDGDAWRPVEVAAAALLRVAGPRAARRLRAASKRCRVLAQVAAVSLLPLAPLTCGVAQVALDLSGFALALAFAAPELAGPADALARRPAALSLILGAKAFGDAFALSLACSAVWKCHFYDRRRPRRARRGLRTLLRCHLFKCVAVACAVACAPVGFHLAGAEELRRSDWDDGGGDVCLDAPRWVHERRCGDDDPRAGLTLLAWRRLEVAFGALGLGGGAVHVVALDLRGLGGGLDGALVASFWHRGGALGAAATCLLWLFAEVATESAFQAYRVLRDSKLAANLCNFPLGDTPHARTASMRAVLKLYAMMCFIPGSASPLLALAANHAAGDLRLPGFPLHLVVYPATACWLAFVIFVKFAFVVFGLNTLSGFEDYDVPGWLLG